MRASARAWTVKLLLELSMECDSLAQAEAVAAANALGCAPRVLSGGPGVLVLDTSADPDDLVSRVALCHHVSEWLGEYGPKDLESTLESVDVPGPIRVRSTKIGQSKVDLSSASRRAGAILGRSRGVDLHNPRSEVRLVFSDRVHVGRLLGSIDRSSFEKRKNRYMPYFYPASVHPKFARALVNLTQAREGERLLDPFCGTGAIVSEASLVGLKAVGTDLSERMIEGSRRNLRHAGAEADLQVCDVGEIPRVVGGVDGIATDPPYGRATSTDGEPIASLYARSFKAFSDVLDRGSRMAIVVPDKKLLAKADGFELQESHKLWVHRSLTRHFCVLTRV
jgi:tRNA (guanine10-N2)-dimethyltransferase